MAKFTAYSSAVITDYSDVGHLNFHLTSNMPSLVIYDTDQNTFTPNWATTNLIITPVVTYNGSSVDLTSTGLQVLFTRQEGSGTATTLATGETVTGNKLVVSDNKLKDVTSKILTYICDITYTDPDTNVPLSGQATLSYCLQEATPQIKDASISGETAFLYDTNRSLVGSNTIVLTAILKNVSVQQWQYKNADGTFVAFPTTNNASITGTTLNVLATESDIWINDKTATIKLVTNDAGAYDIHTIVKIYDGAAGTDTISAVLTNEDHLVPVDSDGNIRSWVGADTTIKIYEGGADVTSEWTITVNKGTGLEGTYNAATFTFTPSGLTTDTSYAEFVCSKDGYADIVKRYTLTKQYAGADGADAVIYEVVPDVYALGLSQAGVFTPTAVTFSAYTKIGSAEVKTSYAGRFIISESTDGSTFEAKYTSSTDESTKAYTPSSNTIKAIKCILYSSGSTTTQLDAQTVIITKEGKDGEAGDNGTDGISFVTGNDSEVIPCDTTGNALVAKDISIPFTAYKGITRAACTCTVGTLPTGVTVKSNTAGTASAAGLLVLTVTQSATFGNSSLMSGDITLTLTSNGVSAEKKFTWAKNNEAQAGQNAVLLQIFSDNGDTIHNGEGSITLQTVLMSGSLEVTPSAFEWAKYVDGEYQILEGETSSTLIVTADMIDSTSWFRCIATYGQTKYTAYMTIFDQSDPVLSYTFATVAEFKNGQGCGAVYTRVYRNGTELDPIKSLVFSETAPESATAGDYYYHLDSTEKTCILKKYSGTEWTTSTDKDELTYSYYRVNGKGAELDTSAPYKTDRCFYVDPSIIEGQMQFRCKVEG